MPRVDQVYFTHCRQSTAVLSSDDSDRIYGYGARASSYNVRELREKIGDSIAPLECTYTLPRDASPDALYSLGPATAPIRLFYCPDSRGFSIVGHVCYRSRDVVDRPGSYFAHCLFSPKQRAVDGWRGLDLLRLWKAEGWQCEDENLDHELLPIDAPQDVRLGLSPSIDRKVVESFLKTEAGGQFHDPGNMITDLCREAPPEIRQRLVEYCLRGFLEARAAQKPFLLVADPELACLLFFAVLCLAPPCLTEGFAGFSTYETDLRNAPYELVATTFVDPESNDLEQNERDLAGFWLNTFRCMEHRPFQYDYEHYPRLILEAVERDGWTAADRILQRIERLKPRSAADLEDCVRGHRLLVSMLTPPFSCPLVNGLSNTSRNYICQIARDTFLSPDGLSEEIQDCLKQVASAAQSVPFLKALQELLSLKEPLPIKELSVVGTRLIGKFFGDVMGTVLEDNEFHIAWGMHAFALIVRNRKRLPGDTQDALGSEKFYGCPTTRLDIIISDYLAKLRQPDDVLYLYDQTTAKNKRPMFVDRILASCSRKPKLMEGLELIVSDRWESHELPQKVLRHGPALPAVSELSREAVIQLLGKLLDTNSVGDWQRNLAILRTAFDYLPEADQSNAERWFDFAEHVSELGRVRDDSHEGLRDACEQIVQSFQKIDRSHCDGIRDEKCLLLGLVEQAAKVPASRRALIDDALGQLLCAKRIKELIGSLEFDHAYRILRLKRKRPWYLFQWIRERIWGTEWIPPTIEFTFPNHWADSVRVDVEVEVKPIGGLVMKKPTKPWPLEPRHKNRPIKIDLKEITRAISKDHVAFTGFTVRLTVHSQWSDELGSCEKSFGREELRKKGFIFTLVDPKGKGQDDIGFTEGLLNSPRREGDSSRGTSGEY
ncbi:MAG: hypothetical protein H8E44_17875 [Planctomycetes bacterium]|nr:hypothetical protein [Planctomycetota bacterium]MBL7037618.1 hypothetical protein [Pirellulaceae bacterium]